VGAVALDLFGTLVAAPTPTTRTTAASRLARIIGCDTKAVNDYFHGTWQDRHDGTLSLLADLAEHLVNAVAGPTTVVEPVMEELYALACSRLIPDTSVIQALTTLRRMGLRIGVLTDASAEIAAAWPESRLADTVDAAIFSCTATYTKPDHRLYARLTHALRVSPQQTLYCGDGGGDELRGATACGMTAIAVSRRGGRDALVFGEVPWSGSMISAVEDLPTYIESWR